MLSLLSEYMLLGLFLALPQHWSQRLDRGQVIILASERDIILPADLLCVSEDPMSKKGGRIITDYG